jgi:hypothetical protein
MLRPCEMMYCITGEASPPSPPVMTRRTPSVHRMSNVVEGDTIMPCPMANALLKGFSGCEVAPSPEVCENRCHG